jgi:uncharacterized membrane protein
MAIGKEQWMEIALVLHVLAAAVWVGGMFFAYMVLRPVAAELLEPPQRLALWAKVFAAFFPWVWFAVISLLLSGYGMLFRFFGGMAGAPIFVHIMQGTGLVMMLIFGHIFFAAFKRLKIAVNDQDWAAGGMRLAQIRKLVGLNLSLGLFTIAVACVGRLAT